jgi:hypothetical protein
VTFGYERDPRATRVDLPAARKPSRSGGADGNEHLTVLTGTILLVLLAAEGVTILRLGQLLTWHFFIGLLLIGPVALKAGSVTYRFFRYYTGHAEYRRKGPPAPLLRLLGPFVMLLTIVVFGSGVMLAVIGPAGRQPWLLFHKASFVLWLGAMAIHVLAYLLRLPRTLYAEALGRAAPEGDGGWSAIRAGQILRGRGTRLVLLLASLALGLVIALLLYHRVDLWQAPGTFFHH